ncbi:MAG: hypothetical protein CMJ78_23590 [Planctomycetaceae bacterium]|nr:hypothetical protein [Planctomycetaceae bacterium]
MFLLRPIRFLVTALVEDNTPKRMAIGFALGVVVGLVPKGNLIAITLMMLLGFLRVNLGTGMVTAFIFSWIGMLLDPVTHMIGLFVLTHEALRSTWISFGDMPLAPWTDFNNSIVLGSFLLGLVLAYPSYRISEPLFAKYTPDWRERLLKLKIVHLLWGTDITNKLT